MRRGGWAAAFATRERPEPAPELRRPQLLVALLTLYATVQVLLPLRPYLFGDGHPAWNYHGFNLA